MPDEPFSTGAQCTGLFGLSSESAVHGSLRRRLLGSYLRVL
jgi:hypothetical protein